jgi:hypothetical protein
MSKAEQKYIDLKAAIERCRSRAAASRSAALKSLYLELAGTYENVLIHVAAGRWMPLNTDSSPR